MNRKLFLTMVACVALAVGSVALLGPGVFLETGKGALPSEAAKVMMREVGVLLVAVGLLGWLVRDHPDSPTLRAILVANAVLQVGIFPIEIAAYQRGVFPLLSGILPNSVFHVLAAAGFAYFAARVTPRPA
ncbi:MAG: hypothetical protein IPJ34_40780 [Myxococcales bacterium]|nr:hypothetical protein [Myxococcales bacterium]